LPITAVTQRNVANLLNNIALRGNVTANRVRASLSAFFGWAIREGIRLPEGNVASYTNKREEKSRERVLSDAELKAIWSACQEDDYGDIIKLLMLTGQRANEIASLHWDEVHDEQIVLPGERTKNHRAHVIPVSEPVKAILAKLRDEDRKHVFGRDDTGFHGWQMARRSLDARIKPPLNPWVPHDLRRTCATRMADLGVQPHVVEAVLNHASGHKAGVAGIYNRATYDREKRDALNLWAEHVLAVIEGRAGVVLPLKRA
jgi:integrase